MLHRLEIKAFVIFLTLSVLLGGVVWGFQNNTTQQRMHNSLVQDTAALAGVRIGLQDSANAIALQIQSNPALLGLLKQLAATQDPNIHQQLYAAIAPLYALLQQRHSRNLSFFSTDGTALLRMQAPQEHGENVLAFRPLLRQVLTTHEPASGFEFGLFFQAYRYIYPLFEGETLLGAFEISVGFSALQDAFAQYAPLHTGFITLLDRDAVLALISNHQGHQSEYFQNLYSTSSIDPGFVIENLDQPQFNAPAAPSITSTLIDIQKRLGATPDIREKLHAGSPFVERVCIDLTTCFIANFLPQRNDDGTLIAYILAITPQTERPQNLVGAFAVFGLGVFLLGLITLIVLKAIQANQLSYAISQQLSEGIYVINPQGIITYVNPRACALVGYEARELLGKNAHDLFHSKIKQHSHRGKPCPIQNTTFHGKNFHSAKATFFHKDGSEIPIEVSSSPIVTEGHVTASVTLFRDIKGRLSEKKRLREVNAAFSHAAEGIIITDTEQRILSVNPAFTHITGYEPEEVIGHTPSFLSSNFQDALFYQALWHELKQNLHWQGEIINRHKSGRLYTERLSITAVQDEDGRITNYTAVFSDISALKEKEQRLQHNALHDALTGLPNRAHLTDQINQALKHAPHKQKLIALLFIDLDRFKVINDSLGHDIGDILLQEVAARMKSCLKPDNLLARQGGDEFVILMDNISHPEDAEDVAKGVIETLKKDFHLAEHNLYVGSSIGISLYPHHGTDASTLLRHADIAMYHAKAEGGNRYQFYENHGDDRAHERLLLEAELHLAIPHNELRLFYQPKLQLNDQRIIGFEALLRWEHPIRGNITPASFLPLLRTTGLIPELGHWVVKHALQNLADWHNQFDLQDRECAVYINLEGENLADETFSEFILQELENHNLPPHCLGIEVTENAFSGQAEKIVSTLHKLRAAGIKIAIDDFGTGHSSLQRIKTLPVDQLKIDASFVRDMLDDPSDRSIVQSTISLAHDLGLSVVAEGVETQAQADLLTRMGCDQVQGYLIAKALPADEAARLMWP